MTQVAALWRGQIPLGKTGWLYGLTGLLLLIVPLTLISSLGFGHSMRELILALSVATLLYAAFMAVAIWRAAGNYQGRRAWRLLAKGSVAFVVLQAVVGFAAG